MNPPLWLLEGRSDCSPCWGRVNSSALFHQLVLYSTCYGPFLYVHFKRPLFFVIQCILAGVLNHLPCLDGFLRRVSKSFERKHTWYFVVAPRIAPHLVLLLLLVAHALLGVRHYVVKGNELNSGLYCRSRGMFVKWASTVGHLLCNLFSAMNIWRGDDYLFPLSLFWLFPLLKAVFLFELTIFLPPPLPTSTVHYIFCIL